MASKFKSKALALGGRTNTPVDRTGLEVVVCKAKRACQLALCLFSYESVPVGHWNRYAVQPQY
jgi:hypothetical protein